MKKIICRICNSSNFKSEGAVFVCENCSCKYSPDDIESITVYSEEVPEEKNTEMATIICRSCGAEVQDSFCSNCGTPVAPVVPNKNEAEVNKNKKFRWVKPLLITLPIILILYLAASLLLTTIFEPYGLYIKTRWHLLWKNYPEAYSALDDLGNEVVLDSGHLRENFKVVYEKEIHKNGAGETITTTEYEYDKDGHLLEQKEERGSISYIFSYEYDKNGNQISAVEGQNGVTLSETEYAYDQYGNITLIETKYDKLEISYEYNKKLAVSGEITVTPKEDSETSASGTFDIERDKKGYITCFSANYEIDGVIPLTLSETIKYTYDSMHYITKTEKTTIITDPNGVLSSSYNETVMDKDKTLSEYSKTTDNSNGESQNSEHKTEYAYDKNGNLLSISQYINGKESYVNEYSYNSNNNRTDFKLYLEGDLISHEEYLDFDSFRNYQTRTVYAYSQGGSSEIEYTYEYEYDDYGNILEKETYQDGTLISSVDYKGYQYYYEVPNKKAVSLNYFYF